MVKKKNKRKIFNDPVYGFIALPNSLVFKLVEHASFQRLRRISQTALTSFVYPGAMHTRFQHALGCMHLMQKAVEVLRYKKVEISKEEESALYAAILLHDVGHGPFSHALENTIAEGVHHEELSLRVMKKINSEMNGELDLCIAIFERKYHRKFFSQLISSQLDVDRLDYLKRDSFYSGVAEGNINSDRIISMFNVHEGKLVLDAKGIYSIEKFLLSRVFMYWQVYFHKTSTAVEIYLTQALRRAKELSNEGIDLKSSVALNYFLKRKPGEISNEDMQVFLTLDDTDIWSAIKSWQMSPDFILSTLCKMIVQRKLPTTFITREKLDENELNKLKNSISSDFGENIVDYFVHQMKISVTPYSKADYPVEILYNSGEVVDLLDTDHQVMGDVLRQKQVKYHVCYPDVKKMSNLKF